MTPNLPVNQAAGRMRAFCWTLVAMAAMPTPSYGVDYVWTVSPYPALCSQVKQICVTWVSLKVDRTPNDAGSYEEWEMTFRSDQGTSSGVHVNPKDRSRSPQAFPVGLKLCSASDNSHFKFSVKGKEDDAWPNADDPVPQSLVQVVNTCVLAFPGEPPKPPVKLPKPPNSLVDGLLTICNWGGERFGCFAFSVGYR